MLVKDFIHRLQTLVDEDPSLLKAEIGPFHHRFIGYVLRPIDSIEVIEHTIDKKQNTKIGVAIKYSPENF